MKQRMQSIRGMELKTILVEQIAAYQKKDGWEYLCTDPVLHFQSESDPNQKTYWILSWQETEEGDDELLIDETHEPDTLSQFQRVEGFREPVIVSSSIHLENASVQSIVVYGFKDEEQEFLTSIVLELEEVYVTFTSGPVYTVIVTNTFPENVDGELFRVGE